MEKGLIPSNLEILAFAIFIGVTCYIGWNIMTNENFGVAFQIQECDSKYGENNWTLEPINCGVTSLGCEYECVAKVG